MTNDYKAALDWLDYSTQILKEHLCKEGSVYREMDEHILNIHNTLRHALRIADKLMEEPSDGVVEAGGQLDGTHYGIDNLSDIFKAMRDQMLKEIRNDNHHNCFVSTLEG